MPARTIDDDDVDVEPRGGAMQFLCDDLGTEAVGVTVDGETIELGPGEAVRVDPGEHRRIEAEAGSLLVLAGADR